MARFNMERRQVGRRPAGRGAAALLTAALLLSAGLGCRGPAGTAAERWRRTAMDDPESRLDVVLVTVDTLRADRLGCYGAERVETPAIDALAREGVLFSNAAGTVPFTLPAHSSIMTGTYPPYHGVRENVGYRLEAGIPTLAERLRDAGYATGGFVSAFVLDSRWGIGRGFDTYFDDFELGEDRRANLGSVQRDGAETLAAALRWLDGLDGRAFFLWLHLFDPHDPYRPPEPFASRYPGRPYEAEVAYADSLVGRLRAALEERGLFSRALFVFTGDHGEGLGQHREGFHGFFVYDSTVRVPLVVRAPSGRLAGRRVTDPVSHVDLLPTILEAARVGVPPEAQGKSLLGLMLEPDAGRSAAIYTESLYPLLHYGWSPLKALRTERFKYIEAPRPELYDLLEDPDEERNLAPERARTVLDLRDRLRELSAAIEAPGGGRSARQELDEETLEQLRALGYLAGRGEAADAPGGADGGSRADPKDKIGLHQLIMRARSDLGAGDEAAAERRLREVLERDAQIVDANQMLGALLLHAGRGEEAVPYFQSALGLAPDHRESLWGLAQAYRQTGRPDEALVGFRRLRELDPEDRRSSLAMARIHAGRGEPSEAIALLEPLAAAPEAAAPLLNELGELLVAAGRRREAEERFRQAAERDGELARPLFNLAVLLEERGDARAAVEHYEAAIARAPGHFQAQFNLGRLYGALGDAERQREHFEAAVEANPEFVRGHYFLAKALMDAGSELERAEELTRRGLALDPEDRAGPLGYLLLADILNRTGRPDEALFALGRARAIQTRDANGTGSR